MPEVRIAAAVVLTRGHGPDLEIYLVERNPELRFFGGYWACPGGVLEADDEGDGTRVDALRRCAARELAEEVELSVDASRLTEICTITTPELAPVRYETLFLLGQLDRDESPHVTPGELVAGRFWKPATALDAWR